MKPLAPILFAFLAACATVPPRAGFNDVERLARDRGIQTLSRRGEVEDPALTRRLSEILASELDADRAVQVALVRSPRLQAVYEELSIGQADLVQAGLPRNPTIGAQLRIPAGASGLGAELAFAQSVVDLLQLPVRKQLAAAAFEAAKLRVTGEILDVAAETRTAFYELQAAAQLREMRASVVDALQASYELAERLHAAGNVNDYELSLERGLYEQTRLELSRAEVEVAVAKTRVDGLMGLSGRATSWTFGQRLPALPASEIELDRVESRAIASSLELGVLREDVFIAGGVLGLAKTYALLPSLTIGASAERELDGAWGGGPALSVPLPIFDQGQARIALAEAQVRRLDELRASVAIEIRAVTRAARARLVAARQRVDYLARVLLPLRARIVDQAQLQYNAMQIGAFPLLDARRVEIEAGASFVSELRDYWSARTEIERLLNGRLGRPLARAGSVPAAPGETAPAH